MLAVTKRTKWETTIVLLGSDDTVPAMEYCIRNDS